MMAEFLILFGGMLALLLSLILTLKNLYNKERTASEFLLGLIFINLAGIMLRVARLTPGEVPPPGFFGFFSSIFLMGPLIKFQLLKMFGMPERKIRQSVMVEVLPGALLFLFEMMRLFAGGNFPEPVIIRTLLALLLIHVFIYFLYYVWQSARVKIEIHIHYNLALIAIIMIPIAAIVLIFAGYFLPSLSVFRIGGSLLTLEVSLVLAVLIIAPGFFHSLQAEIKERYARTNLTGIDFDDLENRLRELMIGERLYEDSGLTLSQLAERLSLTRNQLSRLLNEKYGRNFKDFVNHYRIEAACEILLADPEKNVLMIAYEVGFNSKSAFNARFLKQTGLTPVEFRLKKS